MQNLARRAHRTGRTPYRGSVATEQTILVVEDEGAIAAGLERALTAEGYRVLVASDGRTARSSLDPVPALVLLDLGLPDVDGLVLCREIKLSLPMTPIVMLTARGEEIDIVLGLNAGAVDYVSKPFRLAELLARVRAHLRDRVTMAEGFIECNQIRIDVLARRVWVVDREIELRNKEFDLLVALASRPGQVVTREELMSEIWDEHWFGSTKTLDVHMSSLRRRVASSGVRCITTLRGIGYRFEAR